MGNYLVVKFESLHFPPEKPQINKFVIEKKDETDTSPPIIKDIWILST